jgi:hypothetical protein
MFEVLVRLFEEQNADRKAEYDDAGAHKVREEVRVAGEDGVRGEEGWVVFDRLGKHST